MKGPGRAWHEDPRDGSVYMLRSALLALPPEVEEAALCDGCTRIGVVRRIVLPLLRPTVIAVAAFTFTLCWGEYLFALSILTGGAQQTGPLALQSLFSLYTLPLGTILAGGVVISVPVVVLFLIVQRHQTVRPLIRKPLAIFGARAAAIAPASL